MCEFDDFKALVDTEVCLGQVQCESASRNIRSGQTQLHENPNINKTPKFKEGLYSSTRFLSVLRLPAKAGLDVGLSAVFHAQISSNFFSTVLLVSFFLLSLTDCSPIFQLHICVCICY